MAAECCSPSPGQAIENMDEFDEASPQRIAYCKQMTVAEFEDQASTETEKALQELLEHIDGNNDVYMNILKKRKQEELESSGILSYLKAKVMRTLQGDNYSGDRVEAMEFLWKKDELKRGISRAFDYAQEAKGRRTSKRLADKRHARENIENTPIRGRPPLRRGSAGRVPPPAPPPPPMFGTPKALPPRKTGTPMGPPLPPPLPNMVTPLKERNSLVNTPRSVGKPLTKSKFKGSTTSLSSVTSLDSIHSEILSGNPLRRLKTTRQIRSPGGTPSNDNKRKSASRLAVKDSLEKVFLSVMEKKFRNIRSPSPVTDGRRSSIQSPGGFSPYSP